MIQIGMSKSIRGGVEQSNGRPILFGVVGAGGYAGTICRHLLGARARGQIQLFATCEPEPQKHAATIANLRDNGVHVFSSLNELLASEVQAVWLPLPIDLHRPFTVKALAAGKAVMVEKPAAGCIQDVDAMIAARDASQKLLAVGFQHLYNPQIHQIKRDIASGIIGPVVSASIMACWPRDEGYFQRTSWAGRITRDSVWVLDSPANNALSHFIIMLMYLLAPEGSEVAEPVKIEAELYRANKIENYDTCSLRIQLSTGVPLLVLFTHACKKEDGPSIIIRGKQGTMRLSNEIEIQTHSQTIRNPMPNFEQLHRCMQEGFVRRFHGEPVEIATIEMARAHTLAINGASEACAITDIPAEFVSTSTGTDGKILHAITNCEQIFEQCQARETMLHESGLLQWTLPPKSMDLQNYHHFAGPKTERVKQLNH